MDEPYLIITTSAGVFHLKPSLSKPELILSSNVSCKSGPRGELGFFGIAGIPGTNRVLIAERFKRKKYLFWKKDRTVLHAFDTRMRKFLRRTIVEDCGDVHQITCTDKAVFLTDTAKNRVVLLNLEKMDCIGALNFGPLRRDVNHINAVTTYKNTLYVNLNNRGLYESSIVSIPLLKIENLIKLDDINGFVSERKLRSVTHSHDLQIVENVLYSSDSKRGFVFNVRTEHPIVETVGWVRGLDSDGRHLYVGISKKATRDQRHRKSLTAWVEKYDLHTKQKIETFKIPGCGQVNDIFLYRK